MFLQKVLVVRVGKTMLQFMRVPLPVRQEILLIYLETIMVMMF